MISGNSHSRRHRALAPFAAALAGLVLGLALIAWLRPTVIRSISAPVAPVAGTHGGGLSAHVVIVSIDGLRPDAIERYDAATLRRLMRSGRYTLHAQTVVPTRTLPAHASMLTGASVEQHGVSWNEPLVDSVLAVPTIFERAREHGLHTAAFFSKPKMGIIATAPGILHSQWVVDGGMGMLGRDVQRNVRGLLEQRTPHLLFVHIGEPDYIGHIAGWMTPFYGNAVRTADSVLRRIIDAADAAYGTGDYTLIVTADHGGHGRDHTGVAPADVLIPWIVAGRGVDGTGTLTSPVNVADTGPTALRLLGVPVDSGLAGRPVMEALHQP